MSTKRNDPLDFNIPLSLRVSQDQHDALKVLAASAHRTVSQELRVAIDAHVALNTERKAA